MGPVASRNRNRFYKLKSAPREELDLTWMGWHPIHRAAYRGDVVMMRKLLREGAYFDAVDAEGRTPLHFARARKFGTCNDTVANMLIREGACDQTPLDKRGRAPIDVYAMYN